MNISRPLSVLLPLVILTGFLHLLSFTIPLTAAAQEVGVSIRPAQIDTSMDPGQAREFSVTVENLNTSEQTFYLFTRNISRIGGEGAPIFAAEGERTGFELAEWIELETQEITLSPRGTQQVSFTIDVPEGASPGSHFGGVFVSAEPPRIENSGAAVGYQVANIINIRVSGDIVEEASIRQFSTSQFVYGSQNVEFQARIENSGNVLVRPRGPLEIYNMLGNQVGSIVFNESGAAVLPRFVNTDGEVVSEGSREFANIVLEGDAIGFGRYEAVLSPIYGEDGARKTMSSTVSFWIIPMQVIGPALGVLAVFALITFLLVRLYIRRSLAHLSQGRRVIRQRKKGGSSAVLLFVVVMLTVTALFLLVLLALFA